MRRVLMLALLGALLATVGWWFLLIGPRNARITDLQDQSFVATDTEQRLRVQIQQLRDIRDREVEYVAAVGRLNALIPDQPLLEEFIEQVHTLALDTGIDLQSLSPSVPSPPADGSELRQIEVSAQVEGEFFEILGFLFGLSDMERLIRVDGVSLSSSIEEDGSTILSASLELRLFTLADLLPTETPTPDGADGNGTSDTTSPTSIPEAGGTP